MPWAWFPPAKAHLNRFPGFPPKFSIINQPKQKKNELRNHVDVQISPREVRLRYVLGFPRGLNSTNATNLVLEGLLYYSRSAESLSALDPTPDKPSLASPAALSPVLG
jgi:hypothetical protein